jgi:hypothetical protein
LYPFEFGLNKLLISVNTRIFILNLGLSFFCDVKADEINFIDNNKTVSLEAKQSLESNYGLISDEYWNKKTLTSAPHNVIAAADSFARASFHYESVDIFVERKRIYTFVGSSNTLVIAANDSRHTNNGAFPLSGAYRYFDYNAIGITAPKIFKNDTLDWTVTAKLLRLNDFKTINGNGVLNYSSPNFSLTGNLQRTGTESPGFFVDPAATEMGYGYSIDGSVKFSKPDFELLIQLQNISSQIVVENYFLSNLVARSNQVGNSFIFSVVPKLSGNYGQSSTPLRLPIMSEIYLNSKFDPGIGVGFRGIDSNYYYFLRKKFDYKNFETSFESNSLNVFTITLARKNLFLPNLDVSVAATTTFETNPSYIMTGLKYSY